MKNTIDTEGPLNKQNITTNIDLLPNNQNIHVTQSKNIMIMVQFFFYWWDQTGGVNSLLNQHLLINPTVK